MRSILCFGDSNTWGFNPVNKERFGRPIRWTGVLQQELGSDYAVIEEGCNGRTTVWDDPIEGYKNGQDYLVPCLASHRPIDVVVLMLGTNDLKKRFSLSAFDIASGVGVLVNLIQKSDCGPQGGPPALLVLVPPPLARLTEFAGMFEDASEKSKHLSEQYQRMALEQHCQLLDTSQVIRSSDIDGIHLEAGDHKKLGQAVAGRLRLMLR